MSILDKLEKTLFRPPAHLMLREVRNATGYQRVTRSADALVVSLWPSRGVWFACVEVKESRSDWLRELKDPQKAEEVGAFCEYMWLAARPGIVEEFEVPAAWGLVTVPTSGKVKVVKVAPKRKPKPLTAAFVAAVLRNRGAHEEGLRGRIKDELRREQIAAGVEVHEPVSREVEELQAQVRARDMTISQLRRDFDRGERTRRDFEAAAGVRIELWNGPNCGATFELAQRLLGYGSLASSAGALEATARQLREVHQALLEREKPANANAPMSGAEFVETFGDALDPELAEEFLRRTEAES